MSGTEGQKYAFAYHWYWFSFSLKGQNQGVCIINAPTLEQAREEAEDLKIWPENDHVEAYLLNAKPVDLKEDVLITPEELTKKGYTRVKSKAKK